MLQVLTNGLEGSLFVKRERIALQQHASQNMVVILGVLMKLERKRAFFHGGVEAEDDSPQAQGPVVAVC